MISTSREEQGSPGAPVGNARLLDGVTGAEHRVAAVAGVQGLRLLPVDPLAAAPHCPLLWRWDEIFRPAAAGDTPLFTSTMAPDARLTVTEPGLARTITAKATGDERSSGPGDRFFKRRPSAFVAISATAVIGAILILLLAPISAGIARLLPTETGATVADGVIDGLAETFGRCTDPGGMRALRHLNERLARAIGLPPPAIAVIDWDVVNAFALPGGRIVLTDGLIRKAQDPSEIAAVLAHEIAHVVHRDPTTGWIRGEGVDLLMTAIFEPSTTGSLVEALTGSLLDARYTQDQEQRADQTAVGILRLTGISAAGGAAFFTRLSKQEADGAIGSMVALISTHPGSAERATLFRDASTGTRPGLNPDQFTALKALCGPDGK